MKSSAEVGRPGNTATRIWSSGTLVTCKDVVTEEWGPGGSSLPQVNNKDIGYAFLIQYLRHSFQYTFRLFFSFPRTARQRISFSTSSALTYIFHETKILLNTKLILLNTTKTKILL